MFDAMFAAFCLYFSILLGIGIYFYRKTQSAAEFSSGNRSLNYWLTAITAQASDMSDWLFMGFPGLIYVVGLSGAWFAFGLAAFMFLTWTFIAPAIRKQTEQYNVMTLSSFFEKKLHDESKLIKIVSGFFSLYFFTFYIAAGVVGLGRVFETIFEVPYHQGIFLGLGLSLIYTLLGGLLAVAWSNLLQGVFLLACIMFVPLYAINVKLGGFAQLSNSLNLFGPQYFSLWPTGGIMAVILSILRWGPGYFGQPHILINFMGINDPKNLFKAKIVGCTWQILALSSAVLVGIVGKAMLFPTLASPQLVFIIMVKQLFTPFFAGFILCSVLAATVSTINIQSLICASLISQDLYFPLFNPNGTEKQRMLFTRLALFIIPTLSLIIAWNETFTVLDLVLYAWAGLGSTFGPIVILSLYSNSLTRNGALAGLLAGGFTAAFWPINGVIPTLVAGYLINFLVALLVSKIRK
ncbi:MAG: sodium/proline symporter [Candidatus Dependentiae bacterium]|nr:sodium/proline symporter [Candidatus Dependentiae bacterium]